MELPFYPAVSLLGLYPKNPETPIQKNLCTPMFIAKQFTIAKCWKQPKCSSVNEWIKKLVHLHNGILHSRDKEGAYTLCDSMDGTGKHYAKQNKPGGEGQIPYDLTFKRNIINNNKKRKENITRDTESKNNLTVTRGEGGGGNGGKGFQELL